MITIDPIRAADLELVASISEIVLVAKGEGITCDTPILEMLGCALRRDSRGETSGAGA